MATITKSLTIESQGTYNLTFDLWSYSEWAASAGITTSYASLAALIADEKAVRQLMTVHASVDYFANCPDSTIISTVINNDLCAKWINLRDYALDTLSAKSNIKSVMDTADKYFYGEWGLVGQVPTMTSNTAPSGVAFASAWHGNNHLPYHAFDGSDTYRYDWETSTTSLGEYVGYIFTEPKIIKKIYLGNRTGYDSYITQACEWIVEASNDTTTGLDGTWTNIGTITQPADSVRRYYDIPNDTAYKAYRIKCNTAGGNYNGVIVVQVLQFLAYAPLGNVPIMTANNAPYGIASAYQVFDGNSSTTASGTDFSYQSINPICVRKFECSVSGGTLQGSNDGSTYTTISNPSTNTAYYMYHRVHFASSQTVHTLQFYGRELPVKQASAPTDGREYVHIGSDYYTEDWGEKEFTAGSTRKTIYDHGVEVNGVMSIENATKLNDCIRITSANGYCSQVIDTTNYTYMGGKAGLHASGTNRLLCGSAMSNFTSANMPNSNSIDITNVNGSNTVAVIQTASGTFDVKEVWLE